MTNGTETKLFPLPYFHYGNLQAFMALCGLMNLLHENKKEWKPACQWKETNDTRGFCPTIRLSVSTTEKEFASIVYKNVKKDLRKKSEHWIDNLKTDNEKIIQPLAFCFPEEPKKSPFWMADVKPAKTAKASMENLTEDHIGDSLFKKWDYGERSTKFKRAGDKNKYIPVGKLGYDPIYSNRTQSKLGYRPKDDKSVPVEGGANALAGCGWDMFPCIPLVKGNVSAPCYFREKNANMVRYPLWNVWLDFEEIKSLLWSNWHEFSNPQLEAIGITDIISVKIEKKEKGGWRPLQGQIFKKIV